MTSHYKALIGRLYHRLHGDEEEVYQIKIKMLEERVGDLSSRLAVTSKLYDSLLEEYTKLEYRNKELTSQRNESDRHKERTDVVRKRASS